MALDTLQSRERQIALFERYAALLTEHQREILDLYLGRDWSLSEIAKTQNTSRAAVHDLIQRATQGMEQYEERLALLAREEERKRAAARMRSEIARLSRRLERLEARLGSIP